MELNKENKQRLITMNRQWCALVAWIMLLAGMTACNMDNGDFASLEELGTTKNTYEVGADAGEFDLQVYANRDYHVSLVDAGEWVEVDKTALSGDEVLHVQYDFNTGFPRMAKICLQADDASLTDTIYLKQAGEQVPAMKLKSSNVTVHGYGGEVTVGLDTNLKWEDMQVDTTYTSKDAGGWIQSITYAGGVLNIQTEANPDERALRTATVKLSYIDGWGDKKESLLYLVQANAKDELGVEASFQDVRNLADVDPVTIEDDIFITGYVVSDKESGNAGENTESTTSSIDYTISQRTVYIESTDGKYGFNVLTATPADNVFKRYSKVQLLLKGTKIKMEEEPERYTLTDVTSAMLMTTVQGTAASLPVKEKYMDELTDDDVYTYVTLKDCEFPVRKGSLTPINEGYSNAGGASRISKYAVLLRDKHGNSMYTYTNTTCKYRRDGTRLPYGSGDFAGVIVHENFTHFEYLEGTDIDEEKAGNLGRYQIRHMSRADIRMADNIKDSFSQLLTEYRYVKVGNKDGYWLPTYGNNGRFTHTYANYSNGSNGMHGIGIGEWSYLGPIGTSASLPFGKNVGNVNGFGIILEDGTDYMKSYSANTDGKGAVSGNGFLAWGNRFWWDEEKNRGYAWVVEFSTKGISTDQLSMQTSVLNNAQTSGAQVGKPRYWKVEWSVTGNMDNDADWTYIASYTVPDVVIWSNTLNSQCPGFKPVNIKLPLDMLGHEKVYLRMMPANNKASNGTSYVDPGVYIDVTGSSGAGSAMNYFAIRYNK